MEDVKMYLGAVVIDSDDSDKLSDFYQKMLGWKKEKPDDEWIIVSSGELHTTSLVFQQIENYKRPTWPSEAELQQQMLHIDFYVAHDELEKATQHAVECGAQISEIQFSDKWHVMIDPAGHPFCIIPIPLALS